MEKDIRNLNIIFAKDGHGRTVNRLTIPKTWVDEIGFTQDERTAEVIFDRENKIITIKKKIK